MKYDVILQAVVSVKLPGIEADSQLDAIEKAEAIAALEKVLDHTLDSNPVAYTEYADEIVGYVVDEENDPDYERTRYYNADRKVVKP